MGTALRAAAAVLVVATAARPASADFLNSAESATSTSTETGGLVQVGGSHGGGGSSGSSGPSPYTDCARHGTWQLGWRSFDGSFIFGGGLADDHSAEEIAAADSWTQCGLADAPGTTAEWLNNPSTPGAEILVAFAEEQLELELPTVVTSPVRGGLQLVGVPVWFWVDNFDATSTTAEVPGLAATLTASPARSRFQITGPGPGGPGGTSDNVVCEGAGTEWKPGSGGDPWAGSDCSYAFDWSGTFTVEAIVDWELTWSATNGQTGTLPGVSRTSTFTINIEQAQAVLD